MEFLPILLIACACIGQALSDASCPKFCKCTSEGVSGTTAKCTELDPRQQFFFSNVQHLIVANRDNGKMSLTEGIFKELGLTKLESLQIVNSTLCDVNKNAFEGMDSLFDVNLADNRLFLIHPDTFINNTNLHRLKISGNPLQLMQLLQTTLNYLLKSTSITEFDLSHCQLTQILPKTFSQMKNLLFVDLSGNYLKFIPKKAFEDLEFLEELDLSRNLIMDLPSDSFSANRELSSLKLSKNNIEFMQGLDLPELEELDMSFNHLRLLMKETLAGMPQVVQLNFSFNHIEILSEDAFSELEALKNLDLSENLLVGPLPRGILSNNEELETLILSGNRDLGILVEEEGFETKHEALIKLEIADCGLANLSASYFKGMQSLSILNASGNAITSLDGDTFKKLTRLSHLDLSDNRLSVLPFDLFFANRELIRLKLSGNPLIELPTLVFEPLTNLKVLECSRCHLHKLWDNAASFGSDRHILTNLAYLDVSQNSMKSVHIRDFTSLEKLEKIDLYRNPLNCVKMTIQLIEWFVTKQIEPYQKDDRKETTRWNQLIDDICPVKAINEVRKSVRLEQVDKKSIIGRQETIADESPSKLDNEAIELLDEDARKTIETIHEMDGDDRVTVLLATTFFIITFLVALLLILYVWGDILKRRYATTTYSHPAALGGAIKRQNSSGKTLYCKLYNECSVPKVNPKACMTFAPIQVLKKGNGYHIMQNEDVVPTHV